MTVDSEKRTRRFTLAEANASLPLVRAITGDIVELTQSMMDRRERLQYLKQGRDPRRSDIYQDELDDIEQILDADAARLKVLVDELTDLGVELKSLPEGLIDFPSTRNGRPVYLCWKYDEPEVAYWHELNAGFSGRQALASDELPPRLKNDSLQADDLISKAASSQSISKSEALSNSKSIADPSNSEGAASEERAPDSLGSDQDIERNDIERN